MKSTVYTVLKLLAGVLTVAVIFLEPYIPQRVIVLQPNASVPSTIYWHEREEGKTSSYWVDEDRQAFYCEFLPGDHYSCGYSLSLSEDSITGLDLSSFHSLKVLLHYKGDAPRIRFSLRNFSPDYDDIEDPNQSAKFMSVVVHTSDLVGPIDVALSELSVAEWWIQGFDVPRAHAAPAFDNVISIGIDFTSHSRNTVIVERIELVGDWIKKETFYLVIITIWMTLIFSEGVPKAYAIYKRSKTASKRIDSLLSDYQKLEVEKREFETLSTTDTLTGALNRAGMQLFLDKLFAEGHDHSGVGLMILDIDHFKRINDRRGHDVGDRVLKGMSQVITCNLRQTDVFARWGGEEFILICPKTSREHLSILAEKIRSAVQAQRFEEETGPLSITISVGATLASAGESFERLFKRADIALYKAKNGGRNCVVFANENE